MRPKDIYLYLLICSYNDSSLAPFCFFFSFFLVIVVYRYIKVTSYHYSYLTCLYILKKFIDGGERGAAQKMNPSVDHKKKMLAIYFVNCYISQKMNRCLCPCLYIYLIVVLGIGYAEQDTKKLWTNLDANVTGTRQKAVCPLGALLQTPRVAAANGSAAVIYPAVGVCVTATMASAAGKQAPKIVTKTAAGGTGTVGASGGPPVLPLASPLMGKKKKPFLGMPAPLGYVPGLGRG